MKRKILISVLALATLGSQAPAQAGDWHGRHVHRHPNGGWGNGVPYVPPSYPHWAWRQPDRLWVPPPNPVPPNAPPACYLPEQGGCPWQHPNGRQAPLPNRGSSFWTAPGAYIDGEGRDTQVDVFGNLGPGGVFLRNRRQP